ncbi:MAG: hypothetical protein FJY97_10780 [candidate division Zixibacteria bacterium]|nr:hypothetical protein [candidate division Zixibacteria bacterium]
MDALLSLDRHETSDVSLTEVARLHERVIQGCSEENKSRIYQTLMDLMETLDFNRRPVAVARFRVYERCIRLARANRYGDVADIVERIGRTWPDMWGTAQHN